MKKVEHLIGMFLQLYFLMQKMTYTYTYLNTQEEQAHPTKESGP